MISVMDPLKILMKSEKIHPISNGEILNLLKGIYQR
jgi:hypothetical protein